MRYKFDAESILNYYKAYYKRRSGKNYGDNQSKSSITLWNEEAASWTVKK